MDVHRLRDAQNSVAAPVAAFRGPSVARRAGVCAEGSGVYFTSIRTQLIVRANALRTGLALSGMNS